jgi:hypothetical protein
VLNLKEIKRMKIIKRISLLLLLVAFISPMGFNEPAFALSKISPKKLFGKLKEILDQIETHDIDLTTDHTDLLDKLNELKTLLDDIDTKTDDIDTATSESCPDSWKKILSGADRFELVMGGAAVLDKETCLVWEQSPDPGTKTWIEAVDGSHNIILGGRGGWRLPTVEEFMTLVDRSNDPTLPVGHLFSSTVQSDEYWTAEVLPSLSTSEYTVHFGGGSVANEAKSSTAIFAWYVRGGHGHEPY